MSSDTLSVDPESARDLEGHQGELSETMLISPPATDLPQLSSDDPGDSPIDPGSVSVLDEDVASDSAVTIVNPGFQGADGPPVHEFIQSSLPTNPTAPVPAASHSPQPSTAPISASSVDRVSPPSVSRTLFILVASYASALTIFLGYLWISDGLLRSRLESLPDLQPLRENEFTIPKIGETLPWGHTLKLGDIRRFGNVNVKVLRVSRGPVEFEYFQKVADAPDRKPTPPVLKLWLEFENVSQDQAFAPLDLRLMTNGYFDDNLRRHGNTFVRNRLETGEDAQLTFAMSHSPDDSMDIKGLEAGRILKPSEKCVVFIPLEEAGLDLLQGELVWRVQFRKGFHPESMHGVTTLIEVEFHSDDIRKES